MNCEKETRRHFASKVANYTPSCFRKMICAPYVEACCSACMRQTSSTGSYPQLPTERNRSTRDVSSSEMPLQSLFSQFRTELTSVNWKVARTAAQELVSCRLLKARGLPAPVLPECHDVTPQ